MSAQQMRVTTPQGDAGELSHEQNQYLFGYQTANAAAAISLTMPVRKAQYGYATLHPIFQMNLPEGFLLEEFQNRLAKIVNLEPMMLLALSGGQSPIGRVAVQSDFVNPLARQQGKGERLSEILAWDGTENLFTELVDKYIYRTGTTSDCRLAPAFDVVNTTAYIPEDVLALDLCGQKSFFSARQGLLDFAKVCQVADPYDRVQRLILTTEFVIEREAEVAQSIPHVVAAIAHCTDMLKEVFFD
jgi:HipA-like protein